MSSPALTDQELIAKTLKNPDNYADIIERYEGPLTRYIGRMVGYEHEVVEDLVQEVFIKAYRSLNGYDPRLKFSSWIYRIAHNISVDYLRKHSKKNHVSLDAEDDINQSLIEKISTGENIELYMNTQEQKNAVRIIISSLPEKYRTVITLAYLEDKSYDEISDILQIPIGTVGTLINRAKKDFLARTSAPQFSHLFNYA